LTHPSDDKESDLVIWIREQKQARIRPATIQRMAKNLFAYPVTEAFIRSVGK
jgi:hypothetical protein